MSRIGKIICKGSSKRMKNECIIFLSSISKRIEQDFAANLFLFNLQSLIEKQTEPYLEAVSRKRKYRYKINKNSSWASLKNRVVNLFLKEDSRTVLIELEKLFGNYLEPIRQGRKYPQIKKRNPNVKYYTLTNYKRAL